MDFSDKEISKFEFSIALMMIFNPTLTPKMNKPSESDFQDAKLLFYYPDEGIRQEEKRNQVGLVEGSYHFWDIFETPIENQKENLGFQIIYLRDYIHILKEVEKNFWLFIVIKPVLQANAIKLIENDYLNTQSFNYNENCFNEENCKKFIEHVYQSFFLFYGSFNSYFIAENNEMSSEFIEITKAFYKSYAVINSQNAQNLNLLKYNLTGVNYSPIDKKKFLSLQYLMNILQAIEGKLEHFALFYSGYYVFSTLDQKDLQILYDYFYSTYNSCEIDNAKIFNKFEKLKAPNIFYGFLNKTNINNSGFLYGPTNLAESKSVNGSKIEENIQLFSPTFNLFDPLKKKIIKQKAFVFYDKNLLLLMTCDPEATIEKAKLLDIQKAIFTNSEKVSQNLSKQLVKITGQLENYRMIYFNKMNLALKMSNKISFASLDFETLKFIDDIKNELETNHNCFVSMKKSLNFWVYGIKGNSRIVTFLISVNVPFQKVEEEKEEIMKFFFSNIFL